MNGGNGGNSYAGGGSGACVVLLVAGLALNACGAVPMPAGTLSPVVVVGRPLGPGETVARQPMPLLFRHAPPRLLPWGRIACTGPGAGCG
jgi:hypothetical protein